ncbi:MAG TPA: protein translocase subunit SecD [Dehalococcoidia bacterium]|nr:protein translocase subunit SecD [Dehalococcoidia bacterium]
MLGNWIGGFFGSILWMLFPSSSRERSIRLSVLVVLILAVSAASLAFPEVRINLPGSNVFTRGSSGPLGLKLGLDLRGGGHLVYQADTETRVDVVFGEEITATQIVDAANEISIPISVKAKGNNTFTITSDIFDVETRDRLETGLNAKFESLEIFQAIETPPPTPDQMEGVLDIINRRVNAFGTEEPIIQTIGDDRIIVQLPGATGSITRVTFSEPVEREDVLTVLVRLEQPFTSLDQDGPRTFRIKTNTLGASRKDEIRNTLAGQLGVPVESFQVNSGIDEAKSLIGQTALLEFKERTCSDRFCIDFTDSDIGLTGDDLERADPVVDSTGIGWSISIQFNDRGTDIFSDLTRRITGVDTKRIAIILDDEQLLAPVARAWIRDGRSEITGNFTREEVRTRSIQLDSGRLPVPLKIIQESDVDALLGSESLKRSLMAGIVGLGLVMLFMVAYYRMAGLVAAVSLVVYSLIVLAIFKMIPITLTLSHIGGFILSIGMAVDANVLIFERMKEEVRIGRTLASSMEVGFNRAWPAIRDGNFSTLITCIVLIWFGDRLGGGLITGFAISLMIGVFASMFTAVVVSRNLLQLLAWIGLGRKISLFTPERLRRAGDAAAGGS